MSLLRRFRADRRGAAAIEFALIAPVMVAIYCGMVEFCQALMAERKAAHVASAVGDLVSRVNTVSTSDLSDIFSIGAEIMQPFPGTGLGMRVTSLTQGASGPPTVSWSRGSGSLAALTSGAPVSIPMALNNGDSVVMAEARYQYNSVLHYLLPSVMTYNEVNYLRPRVSDQVACTGC
jgi:Flp pilus assembly protein TadG